MKKILFGIALVLICLLSLMGCETNSLSEYKILRIAREHCKTRYDYTEITYLEDKEVWEVGFWEKNAKIAAQTVTIDKEGNVVYIWWAE